MDASARPWGGLALAVSLIALGAAAYALLKPPPDAARGGAPPDEVAASAADLRALRGRIEELEKHERHPAELRPAPPSPGMTREEAAEFRKRLAEVEKALGDVAAAPAAAAPAPDQAAARTHESDVQRWIGLLKDPNEGIAFTATRKLSELGDIKAVPPLISVLKTHGDYFTRQGAASTLGELRAADAVPALTDALEDTDDTVQAAANEALTEITGQNFKFSLVLTREEKHQVRDQWITWWRENESDIRKRLKQPK